MRKRGEIRLLSKNLSTTLLTSNLTMCVYTTAQGRGRGHGLETWTTGSLECPRWKRCSQLYIHELPQHLSFKNKLILQQMLQVFYWNKCIECVFMWSFSCEFVWMFVNIIFLSFSFACFFTMVATFQVSFFIMHNKYVCVFVCIYLFIKFCDTSMGVAAQSPVTAQRVTL